LFQFFLQKLVKFRRIRNTILMQSQYIFKKLDLF